ncbi:unnamed protein product [Brachionus calyciflorus]|uniref:VWFA domain-containing protein n=1 Tax=Brachionus calyciflorus TaxID=104777 RepID=A0A813U365_9BILA|nr:unnamed protein product [Brachionus calyciflorus]
MKIIFLIFSLIYIVKSQYPECEQSILDIVFVIDSSGSIGQRNFQEGQKAIADLAGRLNIGPNKVKVGVINYSSVVRREKSLISSDQDKNKIVQSILNMPYLNQATASGDALNVAYSIFNEFGRTLTPRIAVIFTDGYSNTGSNVYEAAKRLRDSKVTVYAIGIGNGINRQELERIADVPSGTYVKMITDYMSLISHMNSIMQTTCETPAFIDEGKRNPLRTEKNEVRNLQLVLPKLSSRSSHYVDVEIDYLKGDTTMQISWLLDNKRIAPDESHVTKSYRLNKNGRSTMFYIYQIPDAASRMYFKLKGVENDNQYDFTVSIY